MAAFEVDLPDYHFGWRQIASLLAGAALVLALLPAIARRRPRAGGACPTGDFERQISNLNGKTGIDEPYRVLWLGDADLLPAAGWPLDAPQIDDIGPGALLSYATSNNGMPDVSDVDRRLRRGATSHLAETLQYAAEGGTSRLGALLAPMGVRYVVVPEANAPSPLETGPTVTPEALLTLLDGQLDLSNLDVAGGIVVVPERRRGVRPEPSCPPTPSSRRAKAGRPTASSPALTDAPTALPDDRATSRSRARSTRPARSTWPRRRQPSGTSGRRPHRRPSGGARVVERVLGAGRRRGTLAFDTPISRTAHADRSARALAGGAHLPVPHPDPDRGGPRPGGAAGRR